MQNAVENANNYFQNRVWDSSAWDGLSNEDKVKALNSSTDDINAILGTQNIGEGVCMGKPPFSFYEKAIFEWALYLISNQDTISKIMSDASSGIIERSVEGFGKERYFKGGAKSELDGYSQAIMDSPAGRMLRAISPDLRIIR